MLVDGLDLEENFLTEIFDLLVLRNSDMKKVDEKRNLKVKINGLG